MVRADASTVLAGPGIATARMDTPFVSIVIVAHNEEATIGRTIESMVEACDFPTEIVLVDDASRDATSTIAMESWGGLRLISNGFERMGVARARNLGASAARGVVLVFADAHVLVPLGWATKLVASIARPGVGAVAPAIRPFEGDAIGYGMTFDEELSVDWITPEDRSTRVVPALCGCFLMVRRDIFTWIGGFDHGFIGYGLEDLELSLRLWTFGYACLVEPTVEVRHLFRDTFRYSYDPVVDLHNQLRFAAVHYNAAALARFAENRRSWGEYPQAFAHLMASDVGWRRQSVWALRRSSAEWYFDAVTRGMAPQAGEAL